MRRQVIEVDKSQSTKVEKKSRKPTSSQNWKTSNSNSVSPGDVGIVYFSDQADPSKRIKKIIHVDKILGTNACPTKIVGHEVITNDEGTRHVGYLLSPDRFTKIKMDDKKEAKTKLLKPEDLDREIAEAMHLRATIGLREGLVYQDIMDSLTVVDSSIPELHVDYKEVSRG